MHSPPRSLARLSTLLAALILPLPAVAQAPVRIMPVGDSITDGSSFDSPDGTGGYRGPLYTLLATAGYNVDYVGSTTVNSGLLVEKEHDGHGGWRIDQIDSNIEGWFGIIKDPDVILLHIGTNDFGDGLTDPTAIDRLDDLITKMALARPYAHIIVTNLMERAGDANTNIVAEFNPYVEARVNAQAALGRRVTFLDMRAAVPLADMPDNLHPDQTGYDKMAAAWLPAIQAVISPDGDSFAPEIARAVAHPDRTHVDVTFSKPVADSAATAGFYSLDGGLTVSAAVLDADKRVVTLTTDPQAPATTYTLTVTGIEDRITPTANVISPGSTAEVSTPTEPGYSNNVPESDCYTLVYSLDIPNAANYSVAAVPYTIDNHAEIGTYDRVAYYMELQAPGGDLQYAWASMDAFDTDPAHIGVPTLASGVTFQQSVGNLNVLSNVAGVTTGEGQTGNIEFWPTNYQTGNAAAVPGASDSLYDFGDTMSAGNYGSMQVHNTTGAQTVISFSHWGGAAGDSCIGIGNQPTGHPDWTFNQNAASYTVKKLQVLVRTTGDTTPPTLVSAQAGFDNRSVTVTFSEPVRRDTLLPANFSLDNGVDVLSVSVGDDLRTVRLVTTTLPGSPLTLAASNLRDTSQNANRITPASTIAVAAAALPAEVLANIGAAADNYELVYSLDIPVTGNFNAAGGPAYTVNNSAKPGSFSRVAYYLELQAGATTQYIWTSMDAFTQDKGRIGVPTVASGARFQQLVTDLEVISNKSGVTTGSAITTGNIEFWPNSYNGTNTIAIPGASGTAFDFGDNFTTSPGYGCMQVHNHGATQTLFALNHFGTDGSTLDVGIGNDPTPTNNGADWTFAANAGTEYSRRTLHVMILPAPLPPAVTANVGAAADNYELIYSIDIPATGNFNAAGGPAYTVNNSAEPGSFSRVAYYLELQTGATTEFIWTSMDAFTGDKRRIGIPTLASGAIFQQPVTNLDVLSNKAGIVTGTGLPGGNLEFWPGNYDGNNTAGVPNATSAFDWGDNRTSAQGYGSMQVHNSAASQTLFAMNRFGTDGNTLCLGIGNDPNPGNGTDWTFENNAGAYSRRTLHVMVLPAPLPAEITTKVPEAADYELVYTLDIPATGNLAGPGAGFTDYALKNDSGTTPFSRVAYYMELQKTGDPQPTYVWVSMDAFTNLRTRIGVPTVASGAYWQRYVSNLNVVSNSPNVTEGSGLSGNLEFWPGNYGTGNDGNIPGASGSLFDFGDGNGGASYGHGSMQVHNYVAQETLFAINHWGTLNNTGNGIALGIGNDPVAASGHTDYTFNYTSAASWDLLRRLHVLVLPAPGAPSIAKAIGSTTLDRLVVTFDRELTDASATTANFTIDGGLTVTGATLLAGNREIALSTSPQVAGTPYTVSVAGVQDRSGGSFTVPGTTAQFTAYTPPAALANVPDAGMELIYQLAIPAAVPQWNINPIPYAVDEAKYGEILFDRVAYLLELDGDWAYVSFDPHTNRIIQTGVPTSTVAPSAFFQNVTNLNVATNVPGVVTGTGITTGNIEFWGQNYNNTNANGVPNASDAIHDFGDQAAPGAYGTLQVHNHGASQTILAYNNWGSNASGSSDVGIGNNPTPPAQGATDWTFTGSATGYTTRNLYVLARFGGTVSAPGPSISIQPCDRLAAAGGGVTFSVTAAGDGPFTYQWRLNGSPIAGATGPWLEIPAAQAAQFGSYDVVVTGPDLGATTSQAADLLLDGTPLEHWRLANGFDPLDGSTPGQGDTEDKEPDGLVNLLEFGFGTDPNVTDNQPLLIDGSANGTPIVDISFGAGVNHDAVFTRRKDHGQPGSVGYTVQFSSDLVNFHGSTDTPVLVADSTDDPAYEIVKVPYPLFTLDGNKARFFRVVVTKVP